MNAKRISSADLAAMTPAEAAAYWFVRHDAGELSAQERRSFESWLLASPGHRSAYEKADLMWRNFERDADEGELRMLRAAALASSPAPRIWQRVAAAAAVVAVIGLTVQTLAVLQREPSVGFPTGDRAVDGAAARYQTARSERSTVTLSDGTVVSMNVDSEMKVIFSARVRQVHVVRGQAFFEVAKDAARPFRVAAADRQILALGTKFDVRLDPGRVQVVLLEGRVAVEPASVLATGAASSRQDAVELLPGQRLMAEDGNVAVTLTNARHATSWRQGWIVFEDEALGAAVAELNRYSDRSIVVPDREVARLRISGVFRIGQPDRFGAIIQELLPVQVVPGEGGELAIVPLS